jgi:hypothetical protein
MRRAIGVPERDDRRGSMHWNAARKVWLMPHSATAWTFKGARCRSGGDFGRCVEEGDRIGCRMKELASVLARWQRWSEGETVRLVKNCLATRLLRSRVYRPPLSLVASLFANERRFHVQTTAIDQTAGIVNLTTVLAHSSGE